MVIVIVYFDNFLFFSPEIAEINSIKRCLSEAYKIKDQKLFGQFTSIEIECPIDEQIIFFLMEIYVQKALNHSRMSDCKPMYSPVVVNMDFINNFHKTNKQKIYLY